MAKKGKSTQDLFGTVHHYDEHGKEVGRSEPSLFGGYTNYDSKGNKIGRSDPDLFGGYNHYDKNGKKQAIQIQTSWAATNTKMQKASTPVQAPPACSSRIIIATVKAAI